jgi:hypothetical protein
MAITVVFDFPGATQAQYEAVIAGLEAQGRLTAEARLFHVACGKADGWLVIDVWETLEAFAEYGDALLPLIQQAGFPPIEPRIYPVHNIMRPQPAVLA